MFGIKLKKAERVEKEKLKQLTLNINDRMEQEEFQGKINFQILKRIQLLKL